MTIYNIQDSKYVPEAISIFQDFSEELGPIDTIVGTPVINITVLTGTDPTPLAMIYLGVGVLGNVVEQRVIAGVPGCIYNISFVAQTAQGKEYTRESFLAVLPLAGTVTPNYTYIYETSLLYPIIYSDGMQGVQILVQGTILPVVNSIDSLQGSQILASGTIITFGPISYSFTDSLGGTTQILISGTYVQYHAVSYSYVDMMKGQQILISGTYVQYFQINYSLVDTMQSTQMLLSGTIH